MEAVDGGRGELANTLAELGFLTWEEANDIRWGRSDAYAPGTKGVNAMASNARVFKAAITAGFYPNMLRVSTRAPAPRATRASAPTPCARLPRPPCPPLGTLWPPPVLPLRPFPFPPCPACLAPSLPPTQPSPCPLPALPPL